MAEPTTVRVLSPEEIASRQLAETPYIRWPDPSQLFLQREVRLRQLAAGHAMRDFLIFMADICAAQHRRLNSPVVVTLPTQQHLAQAAKQGVAPLHPAEHLRAALWLEDLRALLADLQQRAQPAAPQVIQALSNATPEHLNRQADKLLQGITLELDLGQAPLIAAALQVYWTRLVSHTQAAYPDLAFGRIDDATVCPCCASLPVSSISRIGASDAGSRYLHCGLCATEWHMVRIQCACCSSSKSIFYQELEGDGEQSLSTAAPPRGTVRAEACDDCGHYLKIMSMDKDAYVDPVADDLATVALDLLVSDTGLQRHGVNYMLLWGEPEPSGLNDGSS